MAILLIKQSFLNMHKSKIGFLILLLICCHFSIASIAEAGREDKYPNRPIKITVPAAAGGSLGNEIRAIAPFLEKNLGVPIIIEYVTGADGVIAYNKFHTLKPDGYNLLCFNLNSPIPLELTRQSAKYVVKQWSLIAGWNIKYNVLVSHPDNWKTFGEFAADAKNRKLSYAGTGGYQNFQQHLLFLTLGVRFNMIPYASAGEGLIAVMGKHLDFVCAYETTPKPMIQAGKLKALVLLANSRSKILPDVPDFKTLGYGNTPFLPTNGTFAAPPNTPKEIVSIIEKAISKSISSAQFNNIAENVGIAAHFIPTVELQKLAAFQYNLFNQYKEHLN